MNLHHKHSTWNCANAGTTLRGHGDPHASYSGGHNR
jgi:hypothetical protein